MTLPIMDNDMTTKTLENPYRYTPCIHQSFGGWTYMGTAEPVVENGQKVDDLWYYDGNGGLILRCWGKGGIDYMYADSTIKTSSPVIKVWGKHTPNDPYFEEPYLRAKSYGYRLPT